ncbi:phosphorylase kinase alpha/beta subunit [Mytilus galloprovincialis]|uniref:Phosphorylase b kinase regulatory subunit n=1 Tax=Mytilus galloprovincialis TaxID=29158 RepID=A0A8B6H080_MYTGA|nr:phosphorylase kinase alpha/beta subunit [Mytilus galloprovincialis]
MGDIRRGAAAGRRSSSSDNMTFRRLSRMDSRSLSGIYSYIPTHAAVNINAEAQEEDLRKLNIHYSTLKRQILCYQSSTLGMFPSIGNDQKPSNIARVRESIYCATAAWALSQAYRKIDDDQGKTVELAQTAVKCMRGILFCWFRQADKVEKFKLNQSPDFALHSSFDMVTGDPVYGDQDYPHLQIDVVGLYLLFLVQMIASGLKIVYTTDEVNFIQNLVFYVERAYRTPDYGMWERGSKYYNGSTEVHASSIGIAKAALEAINGVNLFGDQGASWSVIYVDIDAHNRNRTIFESILPRESNSKNIDASLLPTIYWPSFAIHEKHITDRTEDKVLRRLKGKFGIKRFLRDGYRTVLEDKNRTFYRPAEIKTFDGIECEWPMFYIYIIITSIIQGDKKVAERYQKELEPLLIKNNEGVLVPMLYYVPKEELDYRHKHNLHKLPSAEGNTDGVFLWGQSLYFISQLLIHDLLKPGDLDPILRHLPASERPKSMINTRYSTFQVTPPDLVTQVVLIAESARLQQLLATYGIQTQTPHQVEPIQIWSPKELSKAYEYLGINKKLKLTGRPKRPFGVLSTSKIYRVCGQTVLCYPLLFEVSDFYLAQDMSVVLDDLKNDLAFLSSCWKLAGRPTFCMLIRENNIRGPNFPEFLDLLSMFKRGDVDGVRVRVGKLQSMITSACTEHLDFLDTVGDEVFQRFEEKAVTQSFKSLTEIPKLPEILDDGEVLREEDLLFKATWDLVEKYKFTPGIQSRSIILKVLYQREGPDFYINEQKITEKIDKLINKAGVYKEWRAVRLLSSLLGKLVDSLAPSITTILVRGKQVTVGVFGHEEEVIDKPISPGEVKNILYSRCAQYDLLQAVLQQELILGIGKLIAASPELFDGILKIRIGWFIRAIQIEKEQEEGCPIDIHSQSPSDIKEMILQVLVQNIFETDCRTPLQQRQIDGALNRTPKDFYDRVWEILEKTPNGIKLAGYHLPQQPTLSDMTMYELNFSLLVEQMLSKIADPAYRQIIVEAFMVVSTMLKRNPEVTFDQAANMDKIIQDSFEDFQRDKAKDKGSEKQDDMRIFFNTPPNVKHGTTSYITKAVLRTLLEGEIKFVNEEMCHIT